MKKLITLGIMSLFAMTSFSQKLDYDTDSKWFFGINAGAAWNTTDVKNKTNLGWGLIFGRAFNYNYGKKISFDLRLRYLRANWYGQDYTRTNVIGNPGYDSLGSVAQLYDTLGYTINNFQADVHEAGLEFVLHVNSLREKTGWDPYIFGGAHITWNQTFGDLYDAALLDTTYYPYSPSGITKPEWNAMSDDIFDTPLDGSQKDKFNVDFMPSLGIGLAYQVSPRFAVGIEHKTTFTLKNNFDGYADESMKWGMFKNDIYHYTSALLKFNLKRKADRPEIISVTDPINNNIVAGNGDCPEPTIKVEAPTSNPMTVYSSSFFVAALIDNISGRENIQFTVNGNLSTNFLYNVNNKKFESNLLLIPGQNQIVISAGNACGTVKKTIAINFVDCTNPIIRFTNPTASGINVDKPNFVISAKLENANTIIYQVNGVNSSNFSFTQVTGDFASNTILRDGTNTVKIIATNDCGTVEETTTIVYTQCAKPSISINGGSTFSTDKPAYVVNASINNVASKSNISFKVNGVVTDFIYNVTTDKFQSNIAVRPGTNSIFITATNDCGTTTQTQTVIYTPCKAPVISSLDPANGTVVNGNQLLVKAMIQNISNVNQVKLTVNGAVKTGGTYNPSTKIYQNSIAIGEGLNTIVVTATTDCGTDSKTTSVRRKVTIVEEEKITICHTDSRSGISEEIVIPLSAWPAHQAHGDVLGPCPIEEVEEEMITICHKPPGNPTNTQEIEIPLSAWPTHQAHGDLLGPCPIEEADEEKITICHKPPGNPTNTQEIEIPLSAWPAHQAHGDVLGPCPIEEVEEEMITICHKPPGNPTNTQEIEIPLSAWPAHQAHGDLLGPCPVEEEQIDRKITICHKPPGNPTNTQELTIPLSAWPAHQAHGDVLGPCPVEEEQLDRKITICHKPPGNPTNTQELTIPLSAWPAHQAHGDVLGPCPVEEEQLDRKITICHKPPGNPTNTQEIEIPLSAWPAHQAHGDVLGPCPAEEIEEEDEIDVEGTSEGTRPGGGSQPAVDPPEGEGRKPGEEEKPKKKNPKEPIKKPGGK